MVETVSKRRTHYEVLGVKPAATGEEIEQAFTRQFGCFRPHTVGGLADVTVAYEALRNPAKRRAYDISLGLEREETPRQSPMTWRIGGQVMTATATPAMRARIAPPVPAEPQVEREPAPPPAEPEAIPFIAASPFAAKLGELASPQPLRERLEAQATPPQPEAEPKDASRADEEQRVDLALSDFRGNAEESGIPWKRAGIVVGAFAAVVALLGAWVGWESVGSAEPAENIASAALPPPTTYTVSDPAAAPDRVLDVAASDVKPSLPKRAQYAAARRVAARSSASRLRPLAAQDEPVADPLAPQAETPVEAAKVPPPVVAAKLPLPNHVIARTIERIGYRCGDVASATTSGTSGAFTVTCTSGHSYRASPVRGRYHFRRLGSG